MIMLRWKNWRVCTTERGEDDKAFDAFEKLYQNDVSSVFFLEETIKLGKRLSKSESWVVGRLEKYTLCSPIIWG